MTQKKTNPGFMTGVPEILILRLLADREMYGYELVRDIETATGAAIKIGEGVVYPILHALEANGYLKASRKPVNGRTRIYYSTTAAGKKRLGLMILEWARINGAVSQVVNGGRHAIAT
jgi:PadR family transcriptional regulator PadR